ncbi:glutamate--cysteine ligase [Nocardia uniformis]|uniref:Putative glutamate--cysteine ligase 2 n=1 Tax=Nocardia uniformis TaxID=53432 RepID=A0A849BZD2_9NOCA|nr:glutamate--cysteine ligase [Nocardia uniformis]NNH70658.1 glutamate--cysteine ligase [Nocardia uniformis]
MEAPPTVGVEEEFLLVDPRTGAAVGRNVDVARTAADFGIDLQLEFSRCQVETSTRVHSTTDGLLRELRELRRGAAMCAEKNNALLLAVGIPPTVSEDLPVTSTPRYRRIAEDFGMLAHEPGLCGCHVHVAVPDREVALQVSNFLRPWLPLYLALTANSAIYRGIETGYASWRSVLWRRWPSAGPPPHFSSVLEYDAAVEMMLSLGVILDRKMVYWDVRPSATFPTVEIRISDVPATVEESALLATLVRATVMTARRDLEAGRQAPAVADDVLRAAYWKAARFGIDGESVNPVDGKLIPARDLLGMLLDHIAPALEQLGDRGFVDESVAALMVHGNGARRQLNAFRERGEIGDVVEELAEATLRSYR